MTPPTPTEPGSQPKHAHLRVVLADDDARLRQALRSLLEEIADVELVGEAADGFDAVRLARDLQPDVILMDVMMPRLNGIEATRQSLAAVPGLRVIALSLHTDEGFVAAMRAAGACDYLLKDRAGDELAPVLQSIRDGGVWLSPGPR